MGIIHGTYLIELLWGVNWLKDVRHLKQCLEYHKYLVNDICHHSSLS